MTRRWAHRTALQATRGGRAGQGNRGNRTDDRVTCEAPGTAQVAPDRAAHEE